jgi:hypothetical protein
VTKIQIDLPGGTAQEAGLPTTQAPDRLLTDTLKRRQAADHLLLIAARVAEAACGRSLMPM